MAKVKPSGKEEVDQYLKTSSHPLINEVNALRKIIISTDKEIGEQIKWNSPAFFYTGEMKSFDPKEYKRDILVMNLHKKEFVLLIFPTGASITDARGLLEGNFPDGRKTIKIHSMKDVNHKQAALQTIIKNWLSLIEKQ